MNVIMTHSLSTNDIAAVDTQYVLVLIVARRRKESASKATDFHVWDTEFILHNFQFFP
jgi:hypothetical protein